MNKIRKIYCQPKYINYRKCKRQIPSTKDKLCARCRNTKIERFQVGRNNNDGQIDNEWRNYENILNIGLNTYNEELNN